MAMMKPRTSTTTTTILTVLRYLVLWMIMTIKGSKDCYCCDALLTAVSWIPGRHPFSPQSCVASPFRTNVQMMSPFALSASTTTPTTRRRRVVETTSGVFLSRHQDYEQDDIPSSSSTSLTKTRVAVERGNDDEEVADGGKKASPFPMKSLLIPSVSLSSATVVAWLTERLARADWWEVRSDATLVACYVLARFLMYDVATGVKSMPGWELDDWIRILSTMSSAVVLAGWWTVTGLVVTQSFEVNSDGYDDDREYSSGKSINRLILTLVHVMIASPLWLMSEQILHFGPPGMDRQYYSADVYLVTGLGLASVMVLAKATTTNWR